MYSPLIGRFLSADSIVPGAGNPQNLNRYSFVGNNPVKYIDPSGHTRLCGVGCDDGNWTPGLAQYGVTITGHWKLEYVQAILSAVSAVGEKLSELVGGTPWQAFQAVYGTSSQSMDFEWGNCPDCNGAGAYTYSAHDIRFASMSEDRPDSVLRRVNNVVHELGHAFRSAMLGLGIDPYQTLEKTQTLDPNFPNRVNLPEGQDLGPNYGFASQQGVLTWQQNGSGTPNEEFADMFLGWTFNTWETERNRFTRDALARSRWMDSYMPLWVDALAGP
jgi:hypothetical protein